MNVYIKDIFFYNNFQTIKWVSVLQHVKVAFYG